MLVSRPKLTGYRVLLHGRGRWLELCHQRPAGCERCLRSTAAFLAQEIAGSSSTAAAAFAAAMERPTEAYQAEFGADLCTLDEARELRRLTIEACWPGMVPDCSAIVADLDLAEVTAR